MTTMRFTINIMRSGMKKITIIMTCILLLGSLCCCAFSGDHSDKAYTVRMNGTNYVIDPENGNIWDGTYTYRYTISGNTGNHTIEITYPNGSVYRSTNQGGVGLGFGTGGLSADYENSHYADGHELHSVLEKSIPRRTIGNKVILIILLLLIGVFNTLYPQAAWYLEYGWRYENAEPSSLALGLNRFGGITAIIVAVAMIVF